MGLQPAAAKTRTCHIDEGFDFLGFRIQRHPKRGTAKRYVYTYPSKKALIAVKAKVRALTRGTTNQTLAALCAQLNLVLRAGPPTSGTAWPRRPSTTCAAMSGNG
jgi:RNA-directed DNA polymerase